MLPLDVHYPPFDCTFFVEHDSAFFSTSEFSYNFKKADFEGMNVMLLSQCWDFCERLPFEDAVQKFYQLLEAAIKQYVPKVSRVDLRFPKWFDRELKGLVRQKTQAHARYKNTHLNEDYKIFSELRRQCKVGSRLAYARYIDEVQASISVNIKNFWNYVNYTRGSSAMPPVLHLGSEAADSPPDIADLFRRHFSSVFSPASSCGTHKGVPSFSTFAMGSVEISEEIVDAQLRSMDPSKGMGPDRVPPAMLRACAGSLAKPLCALFRRSIRLGVVPERWKCSYITPIPKTDDKSRVEFYRPVCSLSAVPKLLEKIMVDRIGPLLRTYLSPTQHGFMPGRSCATNLVAFEHDVMEAFASGAQVDCIHTDFAKAFDKVSHAILMEKLEAFGFFGPLLAWFGSYLQNRQLVVRIRNTLSRPFFQTSGVPQGSHLGPLLFLIYIDDIGASFGGGVGHLLFADDLKIYSVVRSVEDCTVLQDSLDALDGWCIRNDLRLNVEKCSVISFTRSASFVGRNYTIEGVSLRRKSVVRDLGVLLDAGMTFSSHLDEICSRAMRSLGYLKRNTRDFTDPAVVKLLYTSLVRPCLEFSSQVWSPIYTNARESLERVQRRALRYISFKNGQRWEDFSYQEALRENKLCSLEFRRREADAVFLHGLVMGRMDSPYLLSLINIYAPPYTTRLIQPFYIRHSSTNYLRNNPMVRAQGDFNRLAASGAVDLFMETKRSLKIKLRSGGGLS
uniref:Putative RNA-directed DNA polymerase from transposon BS n=1 Tax=Lygus hesperus TaxID=30085 RepID=A0A146MAH9_LYGHE